ncbi:MAG: DUF4167 domain-containing protein [Alphaproteobacteria bacterium]
MRQGPNPKGRSRGRGSNNKKPGGPLRTGSFDNPPSARVRGNAHQMMDKYLALARDASSQGDRVLAENYFQHADHYYRVMSSMGAPNGRPVRQPGQPTPAAPGLESEAAEDAAAEAEARGEDGTDDDDDDDGPEVATA